MKRAIAVLITLSVVCAGGLFVHAQTADPIETIRAHYAQINRAAPNYRKVKKELSGFSAEGGEMLAYFHGPTLMKVIATYFGETGKATEEYYFWDGKLIFVFRTDAHYSKPLSGKITSTGESRFYFRDDKLIRWLDETGKEVPAASDDYGEKQNEYLKTSKLLSEGARSANPTIEAEP